MGRWKFTRNFALILKHNLAYKIKLKTRRTSPQQSFCTGVSKQVDALKTAVLPASDWLGTKRWNPSFKNFCLTKKCMNHT